MEKCLVALNIRGNDSSSTNFSNEEKGDQASSSWSRNSITKQALLYDKEHSLITMLQEVKENETYFLEIIDSKMMAMNQLSTTSPLLQPPNLNENQDSERSFDRGGSFNNSGAQSRTSSLA